jgi:hypothetical protein
LPFGNRARFRSRSPGNLTDLTIPYLPGSPSSKKKMGQAFTSLVSEEDIAARRRFMLSFTASADAILLHQRVVDATVPNLVPLSADAQIRCSLQVAASEAKVLLQRITGRAISYGIDRLMYDVVRADVLLLRIKHFNHGTASGTYTYASPAVVQDIRWQCDAAHRLEHMLTRMPDQLAHTPFYGGLTLAPPEACTMTVTVKGIAPGGIASGAIAPASGFRCNPTWTIWRLKRAISCTDVFFSGHMTVERYGRPEKMRLVFGGRQPIVTGVTPTYLPGRQLDDDLRLGDYRISDGCIIHLIFKLLGAERTDEQSGRIRGCIEPEVKPGGQLTSARRGLRVRVGVDTLDFADGPRRQYVREMRDSLRVEVSLVRPTMGMRTVEADGPVVVRWDRGELLGCLFMWRHSTLAHHLDLRALVLRHLQLAPEEWEGSSPVVCSELQCTALDFCEYVRRDGDDRYLRAPCCFTAHVGPPAAGWKPWSHYTVQVSSHAQEGRAPPWAMRWHFSTSECSDGGPASVGADEEDDDESPIGFIGSGYVLPFDRQVIS